MSTLSPTRHAARRAVPAAPRPGAGAVLTKALIRAASLLGLSNAALARVLGVSEASVSRLASGPARAGAYLQHAGRGERYEFSAAEWV